MAALNRGGLSGSSAPTMRRGMLACASTGLEVQSSQQHRFRLNHRSGHVKHVRNPRR